MRKISHSNIEKFILLAAILKGFRVIGNKYAIDYGFSTYIIIAIQLLIGGTMIIAYSRKYKTVIDFRFIKLTLIGSVLLFFTFFFSIKGLAYTTPSKSAFIQQSTILIVPLIALTIYKTKVDKHTLLGMFICMIGLGILILENGMKDISKGDLLILSCSILVAVHMTYQAHYIKNTDINGLAFTGYQTILVGIYSLLLALFSGQANFDFRVTDFWPMIITGSIIGVNFIINSYGMKYSTPSKQTLIYSISPISSAIISLIVFKDIIGYRLIVGGGMIILALVIIQKKPTLNLKTLFDTEQ